MSNKKRELLKKLQEMANRGEPGEKDNAAALMNKIMKDYGITDANLEEENRTKHSFHPRSGPFGKRLMSQIMSTVLGKKFDLYRRLDRKGWYIVECTHLEYLEIESRYVFYSRLLEEELELYYVAFVHRNRLLPPDAVTKEINGEEEYQEWLKMRRMMNAADMGAYQKRIT